MMKVDKFYDLIFNFDSEEFWLNLVKNPIILDYLFHYKCELWKVIVKLSTDFWDSIVNDRNILSKISEKMCREMWPHMIGTITNNLFWKNISEFPIIFNNFNSRSWNRDVRIAFININADAFWIEVAKNNSLLTDLNDLILYIRSDAFWIQLAQNDSFVDSLGNHIYDNITSEAFWETIKSREGLLSRMYRKTIGLIINVK
jgi:hypothetical protein